MSETSGFRPPRPLTLEQAAHRLNRSRRTVVRLIKAGKLKAFRPGGTPKSHWCVLPSELDKLMS